MNSYNNIINEIRIVKNNILINLNNTSKYFEINKTYIINCCITQIKSSAYFIVKNNTEQPYKRDDNSSFLNSLIYMYFIQMQQEQFPYNIPQLYQTTALPTQFFMLLSSCTIILGTVSIYLLTITIQSFHVFREIFKQYRFLPMAPFVLLSFNIPNAIFGKTQAK